MKHLKKQRQFRWNQKWQEGLKGDSVSLQAATAQETGYNIFYAWSARSNYTLIVRIRDSYQPILLKISDQSAASDTTSLTTTSLPPSTPRVFQRFQSDITTAGMERSGASEKPEEQWKSWRRHPLYPPDRLIASLFACR
ncbi:MAG: hypothetical protein AMK69_08385 [Nitrospira bacterium SG8_3]|nr:MAG: hypothetical protein AMK69_08385 [Nitrospira bacterium SG8_3]